MWVETTQKWFLFTQSQSFLHAYYLSLTVGYKIVNYSVSQHRNILAGTCLCNNLKKKKITEVKQRWAKLVLGWVTAWEYLVL